MWPCHNDYLVPMFSKPEPPLTASEKRMIELHARIVRIERMLGMDFAALAVYLAFLSDGGGWKLSGLAEYTCLSRSAVRRVVERGTKSRSLAKKDGRFFLTERGRHITSRVIREIWAIAEGRQKGFTSALIRHYRDNTPNKIKLEASTIQFPKNIGMFTKE